MSGVGSQLGPKGTAPPVYAVYADGTTENINVWGVSALGANDLAERVALLGLSSGAHPSS
jgi:hypothetical protein